MRLENFRGSDHDFRAIGNDLAPEFSPGVARRGGHKTEGAPTGIRTNIKQPITRVRGETGMMVSIVLVVVFARSNEPKLSRRLVGKQVSDFAGRMTSDGQEEKSAAARAFHCKANPLVRFLIQELVRFCGA